MIKIGQPLQVDPEQAVMTKKAKNRIGLLVLLVILACLGVYWFIQSRQEQERLYPIETTAPSEEQSGLAEEKDAAFVDGTTEEGASSEALPEENPCSRTETTLAEFFRYLDGQPYVQYLDLETDTYTRFKKILKNLSARPPVPAGEGSDPEIITRNIYHFFRALNSKDLRLIREALTNEQDTLEIELAVFYKWLVLYDRCPDPEGLRPSMEVVYDYAGFFINTTGGRAYLFRRPSALRLLVTYYCFLVIHDADKTGNNSYGIDISPHIASLRGEIIRYPDFKFQRRYIDQLNLIESYYMQKRPQGLP